MNKDGMPAEHFQLPLLSLELYGCLFILKFLLSWLFKVSVLMNLKFWKTYNIMVQISLLIKLFLLVFIAAVINLIQIETELYSLAACWTKTAFLPRDISEKHNGQLRLFPEDSTWDGWKDCSEVHKNCRFIQAVSVWSLFIGCNFEYWIESQYPLQITYLPPFTLSSELWLLVLVAVSEMHKVLR